MKRFCFIPHDFIITVFSGKYSLLKAENITHRKLCNLTNPRHCLEDTYAKENYERGENNFLEEENNLFV